MLSIGLKPCGKCLGSVEEDIGRIGRELGEEILVNNVPGEGLMSGKRTHFFKNFS